MNIELPVNGRRREFNVEPTKLLLNLLREELYLTGSKYGCGIGECGACTVYLEGEPILSCMTLAIECGGKKIETVEEVARTHPSLTEKYVEHHAMQCGYCTPGFVVAASALLSRNPRPTEDEIREALAGNLCRCGTYPQHPKAIIEAAESP